MPEKCTGSERLKQWPCLHWPSILVKQHAKTNRLTPIPKIKGVSLANWKNNMDAYPNNTHSKNSFLVTQIPGALTCWH